MGVEYFGETTRSRINLNIRWCGFGTTVSVLTNLQRLVVVELSCMDYSMLVTSEEVETKAKFWSICVKISRTRCSFANLQTGVLHTKIVFFSFCI